MSKKYKNILFDMDGVLINSMKYHTQAWQTTFKKFNIDTTNQKIMNLAGMTSIETIQIICTEKNIFHDDDLIKKIKSEKGKQLDKIFKVEPYPGIIQELVNLKNLGFTLGLVSGCRKFEVDKTIKEFFPDIFTLSISGDDVKFGKPNPEPYHKAIDKLKINKSETVVIEDALSGIESANSANLDVFAITTSFPEKELSKATKIFNTHKELFNYLKL
jgi:HAD superfamily hydrolase (TIGR01509 family)